MAQPVGRYGPRTPITFLCASDMFAHMGTHSLKVLVGRWSDANPHTPIYQALSVADGLMPGDWVHGDGHLAVDAAEMLMNDTTDIYLLNF